MSSFRGVLASAPGKIIVSGEHAVVHGTQAVATVLDRRTFVELRPVETNEVVLDLQVAGLESASSRWTLESIRAALGEDVDLSEAGAVHEIERVTPLVDKLTPENKHPAPSVFLLFYMLLVRARVPLRATVRSQLPIGAGLGSSASFCSSMAAAMVALSAQLGLGPSLALEKVAWTPATFETKVEGVDTAAEEPSAGAKELINLWAYEGERVIHGNPSGVDNTVAVYGGVVVYRRGHRHRHLSHVPALHILVTDTKVPRDTKKLVANVGRLRRERPAMIQHVFDAIELIAEDVVKVLAEHKEHTPEETSGRLGTLLTKNQHLLNFLEVGHPAIDVVHKVGVECELPTKLTGAGGGGCVLSLLPYGVSRDRVGVFESAVREHGFECFQSTIGQSGVLLHTVDGIDRACPKEHAL